jgi:hypothetical protein
MIGMRTNQPPQEACDEGEDGYERVQRTLGGEGRRGERPGQHERRRPEDQDTPEPPLSVGRGYGAHGEHRRAAGEADQREHAAQPGDCRPASPRDASGWRSHHGLGSGQRGTREPARRQSPKDYGCDDRQDRIDDPGVTP